MEALSPEEILHEERIPGGTIRAEFPHEDGSIEGVALNNIQAAINRTCTDFSGNRFGAYIIVPRRFWKQMCREWGEYHGKDWKLLAKNPYGGFMGMYAYVTVYVMPIATIVIKPDIGSLVFEFTIGSTHAITVSKEELVKRYGFERVGYDTRLVYVPWWAGGGFAYAPLPTVLEWATDKYPPAVALIANPPQLAIEQWQRQGFIAGPQDVPRLEEHVEHRDDVIQGQWTDGSNAE